MFLLYVDESGDLNLPDERTFVVGGLAVHESDVRPLSREVEAVMARHLDPHLRHLELHAQPIRKGSGPWRHIPKETKTNLLADLADALATFQDKAKRQFGLFAVVRTPGAVPNADPLERVFEELALRFDPFVRKSGGPQREHGMVVADEAKYEKIVQPLVTDWQEGKGTRFGRLTRIIEVPLFLDSRASRLIQLADFVAHVVYLAYEAKDANLFERLQPGFHREGPTLHGLVHLSPQYWSCPCPACDSRRTEDQQLKPMTWP